MKLLFMFLVGQAVWATEGTETTLGASVSKQISKKLNLKLETEVTSGQLKVMPSLLIQINKNTKLTWKNEIARENKISIKCAWDF